MNFILPAVLTLGAIAIVAAVILSACAKKFAVHEDPRIAQLNEILPQANCGGCGYPGCSSLAKALVRRADRGSLEGLACPVGGNEVMQKVSDLLGLAVANTERKIAVVRCGGTCQMRPKVAEYDGLQTCTAINATGAGETKCGFGCLGAGDCVKACTMGALSINKETGLPEVDADICGGCGACVKACPRNVIELRNYGKVFKGNGRRVWVACQSKDKGPLAKKACSVACIGCGKCAKVCKFDAITIENNVAYIDYNKCKACGLCVRECPSHSIKASFELPAPKAQEEPKTEEA